MKKLLNKLFNIREKSSNEPSKKEQYALQLLQGILSNPNINLGYAEKNVETALEHADTLCKLVELDAHYRKNGTRK